MTVHEIPPFWRGMALAERRRWVASNTPLGRKLMRRSRFTSLPSASSLVLALGASCSGARIQDVHPTQFIAPARNIHLRSVADADPLGHLGTFMPNDLKPEEMDESRAVKTRCTRFLRMKTVESNDENEEIIYVSESTAASLGLPAIVPGLTAGGSVSKTNVRTLKVHYKLSLIMQVDKDAEGLDKCCEAAPDQCTNAAIGTFLKGTGEVLAQEDETESKRAAVSYKAVEADIGNDSKQGWRTVHQFKDAYFAFIVENQSTGSAPVADDCSWCDDLPTSLDGQYFCGVSPHVSDERSGRETAMRDARESAVKYLTSYVGAAPDIDHAAIESLMSDPKVVAAGNSGVASHVKDKKWCTKRHGGPDPYLETKVLAFLPEADRDSGAHDVLEASLDAGKKAGTVSPAQEQQVRHAIDTLKARK